jgi:hypothetical protein
MSIDLQDILHQSAAQFDLRSKFIIFGFMSDQQGQACKKLKRIDVTPLQQQLVSKDQQIGKAFFHWEFMGIPCSLVRTVSLRLGRKQAYVQSWGQGFMPPVAIPHHVLVNVLGGRSAEILISVPWCGEVDTH